jgi:hypothetical protein
MRHELGRYRGEEVKWVKRNKKRKRKTREGEKENERGGKGKGEKRKKGNPKEVSK